jgi:hypothetical protein
MVSSDGATPEHADDRRTQSSSQSLSARALAWADWRMLLGLSIWSLIVTAVVF